jgi:alkanesulfonate monooxygenase SsuD/methylene tetrahydromethanopterin reductase-like flavin-dependent oxidoreductase (luciferase family)
MLEQALSIYRETFQPSETLAKPYAVVAAGVCAAETDEDAIYLRSSQILGFARLRSGNPGKLPRPVHDIASKVPADMLSQINHAMSCSAVGSPATVKAQLEAIIAKYQPDELIVTSMIHDHSARVRCFETVAEILKPMCEGAA